MTEKEEYLNSLATARLKFLRDEWAQIMQARPNYWIAAAEYKLLHDIITAREQKQT